MNKMDFASLFTVPVWVALTFVALVVFYIYLTWNFDYWEKQNVKTAGYPYPVVGTIGVNVVKNLNDIDMGYYKKYGKTWGTYEGRNPGYFTADLDAIKAILIKDFQYFTDKRKFPTVGTSKITRLFLIFMEGEEWKLSRNAITPIFTSGKLRLMSNLMLSCAEDMVGAFNEHIQVHTDSVDIKARFGMFTMDVIAICCFGYKIDARNENDEYLVHANSLFCRKYALTYLISVIMPWLLELFTLNIFPPWVISFFEKVIYKVIRMRKQENIRRNDFLQLLLDAQTQEKTLHSTESRNKTEQSDAGDAQRNEKRNLLMTDEAVVAHSMLFLLNGFETTSTTISLVVYLLALNPDCQDKLVQELENITDEQGKLNHEAVLTLPYLDQVISETLRVYPSSLRVERRCTQDYKLGDVQLKKGMIISIPVYCIHHDETYYPDPEKFDPERFSPENKATRNPYVYIPFGFGPRNCIGMRFGMMETKTAVALFIREFKVSPSHRTEIPVKFRKGFSALIPSNGVFVKIERRTGNNAKVC